MEPINSLSYQKLYNSTRKEFEKVIVEVKDEHGNTHFVKLNQLECIDIEQDKLNERYVEETNHIVIDVLLHMHNEVILNRMKKCKTKEEKADILRFLILHKEES